MLCRAACLISGVRLGLLWMRFVTVFAEGGSTGFGPHPVISVAERIDKASVEKSLNVINLVSPFVKRAGRVPFQYGRDPGRSVRTVLPSCPDRPEWIAPK